MRHRRLQAVVIDGGSVHPRPDRPRNSRDPQTTEPVRGGSSASKAKGSRLVDAVAVVARDDVVLVDGARPDAGDEAFPDAGLPARLETDGWPLFQPLKSPMTADFLGGGGPDGEVNAARPCGCSAQLLVKPKMAALVKEVKIVRSQARVMRSPGAHGNRQ